MRGEEKARLLAGARVVAMPSRMETFGIVAVEAFAAATPVVAFAISSLRAVVPEGAGFAVPPFDVAAYAGRLEQLCTDPDLALAMGAVGREFAAGYDWDVLAARPAADVPEGGGGGDGAASERPGRPVPPERTSVTALGRAGRAQRASR